MWLATLTFCHFSFASTDVSFWNSSVNNRLNQIEVRAVLQDGSGALWFATQEGLTRYNGVRADTFSAANSESGGLRAEEELGEAIQTIQDLNASVQLLLSQVAKAREAEHREPEGV